MRYAPTSRDSVLSQFDNFFSRFEKNFFDDQTTVSDRGIESTITADFIPDIDIEETDDMFLMTTDLPGLKSNEVAINLYGNNLRIVGERRRQSSDDKNSYYERAHGKFFRSFRLPDDIDTTKLEAKFDDGVLRVTLPKRRGTGPQQVKIR